MYFLQVFASCNSNILRISFAPLFMCSVRWLFSWQVNYALPPILPLAINLYMVWASDRTLITLRQSVYYPIYSFVFCGFPQSFLKQCFKLLPVHFCKAFQFINCYHPVIQCYIILKTFVLCMKWTSDGLGLSPKLFRKI